MLGVQIQNLKLYMTRLKFSQTLLIQQYYTYIHIYIYIYINNKDKL